MFGVWGLGFRGKVLRFAVWGLGFRVTPRDGREAAGGYLEVQAVERNVEGVGFRTCNLGFRVQGVGCRV